MMRGFKNPKKLVLHIFDLACAGRVKSRVQKSPIKTPYPLKGVWGFWGFLNPDYEPGGTGGGILNFEPGILNPEF